MHSGIFSGAQLFGYLAFALGVASFSQRDDRRFRLFMAAQCVSYAVHFAWLGRPTAASSSVVSLVRVLASLRTQSPWAAGFFIAAALTLGIWLGDGLASFLPVTASCLGTLALFFLRGVRMRMLLLVATTLWITNNLLAGSYGGTCLEIVVFTVNLTTIVRLLRESRSHEPR